MELIFDCVPSKERKEMKNENFSVQVEVREKVWTIAGSAAAGHSHLF